MSGGLEYPPIGDYGVIGDCRTAALVCRDGSVDWLCLPSFDGRTVFTALLDQRHGGRLRIRPTGPWDAQRRYVGDTNVLETRFTTPDGTVTVTDCLVMLPDAEAAGVLTPQSELLRHVQVHGGAVRLEVLYRPQLDFGEAAVNLTARSANAFVCRDRSRYLLFQSERPLSLNCAADTASGTVLLDQGESMICSLSFVQGDMGILPSLGGDAVERLKRTRSWWQEWADACNYPERNRRAVVRSALVLKLLQHGQSGALVAAPTTSLPEVIGGSRNWDYRFCWLRDAAMTIQAFSDLNYHAEGEQFLGWLLHATRLTWPRLNVLYDVWGETHVPEHNIEHMEGYRGSRPVRTGNAAGAQLQIDVYGAIILAASEHVARGGKFDASEARLLRGFGDVICRCWREPDASIWEIRGARRHYTYSKMMCWSGLNELLKLASDGHLRVRRHRLTRERAAIENSIEQHGYSERRQSYVQTLDGDAADASLLLAARHYRPPTHPRMVGTFDYVDRELARGALVHRYAPASDGLPGDEGAFVMTSFWAVEYLASAGRVEEAQERFDELTTMATDLGLFSEELDATSGTALGNYPQAFSHLGLITAAVALDRAQANPAEAARRNVR